MKLYEDLLKHISLPRFVQVSYQFDTNKVEDPAKETVNALRKAGVLERIKPNASICITCGSREIPNVDVILKAIIDEVKKCGGNPFIIPAMGSHGGATAEGQLDILESYGVTEETMGVPICSSMEVVEIGKTESGMPVYLDKFADSADGIIVFHKIKPHTDFRGKVESGLMKMITVGMGKQRGASTCHKSGDLASAVLEIARVVIKKKPILFGVGVIENSCHQTYEIAAIPGEKIEDAEAELLEKAKSLVAKFPFKKADVLFIDEIGKDITGAGMDPNVTGRSFRLGRWEPNFDKIAVLDITDKSHGNGTGLGHADVTTMRAFKKFDMDATYPNAITCGDNGTIKIPLVMPNDRLAFKFCLDFCSGLDEKTEPRVIWIKNTLCMNNFYISEALLEEAKKIEQIEIISEPMSILFDEKGNVKGFHE